MHDVVLTLEAKHRALLFALVFGARRANRHGAHWYVAASARNIEPVFTIFYAEVLVTNLELVGEGEIIPRQEIEFDEATWPTGVPTVLTEGTIVRLRDAQGGLIFESSLLSK